MKNKGLIIVLIIVVGAIWYNVFFRVVSNFTSDDTVVPTPNEVKSVFESVHRDTFTLNASYRDPFCGSSSTSSVMNTIDPTIPKSEKKIITKPIDFWPIIQYKGMVRKTSSNSPLAIIYIDGIQLQMRKGEKVFDGILLKTITRDSVVVVYKKGRRVFWRE